MRLTAVRVSLLLPTFRYATILNAEKGKIQAANGPK